MKLQYTPSQVLFCLALFLTPIAGGSISTDRVPLEGNAIMGALLGDAAVPILSQAFIALIIAAGTVLVLLRSSVLQTPSLRLTIPLGGFLFLALCTFMWSRFRADSIAATLQWLLYGVVFFGLVMAAGRRAGTTAALVSLFAGVVVAALRGIHEYGANAAIDPTWRIFGGWVNPNALAAMLIIGLFVGLGLMARATGTQALVAGLGVGTIGFALLLTQSRGGLLAAGLGVGVLLVLVCLWAGALRGQALLRFAVTAVAIVGLGFALQTRQQAAVPPGQVAAVTALARYANAEGTREQSAEFRRLLWLGALRLMQAYPAGTGPGTYRYYSAQPGLTTQTHLAHNSFLQVGVEKSSLALFLFVAFGVLWLVTTLRGARSMPAEDGLVRAGIYAAIVAIAAHSMIDSDLHYFGVGLSFFALLALTCLLSADAVAPEYTPASLRSGTALCIVVAALGYLYLGVAEMLRSQSRAALASGDAALAKEAVEASLGFSSWHAETQQMAAQIAQTPAEQLDRLQRAADLAPSTSNLRILAGAQARSRQMDEAMRTLARARTLDPNNLTTLKRLMDLYVASNRTEQANEIAQRLVQIEQLPYFQVRSLPELIPTETLEARLLLAEAVNGVEREQLLRQALDGYLNYMRTTLPPLLRMVRAGAPNFAGQSTDDAAIHIGNARTAMTELELIYQVNRNERALYQLRGDEELLDAAESDLTGVR